MVWPKLQKIKYVFWNKEQSINSCHLVYCFDIFHLPNTNRFLCLKATWVSLLTIWVPTYIILKSFHWHFSLLQLNIRHIWAVVATRAVVVARAVIMAWAVAQLVDQMLPTPEVCGLNPVIGKIYVEQCLPSTILRRLKRENGITFNLQNLKPLTKTRRLPKGSFRPA